MYQVQADVFPEVRHQLVRAVEMCPQALQHLIGDGYGEQRQNVRGIGDGTLDEEKFKHWERVRKVTVWTTNRSAAQMPCSWFAKKVRQRW